MSQAFQQMVVNLSRIITDITGVSQGLAAGHLTIKPQSAYQGHFIQIKNALEMAIANQRQVIEDIVPR